ncbi:MAG: Txe/YoeB family addiction module toxin [Elusimicrobiota bacterium]|jgi:Txe/YoeB family toxin of toxin-antitoxin system|nr:Txe/YoeB family addiction module toxin [Elusimicrobiota bacterium]
MSKYKIKILKSAKKDILRIQQHKTLKIKVELLLDIISQNPYQTPPTYEKLSGNLQGSISRRINKQHRLIYEVREYEKIIAIFSMWTHYE